ncbi:hypothetical protein A2631_02225 [Candidatus Daviesbacteria bacterium RIFCSPHIGHO2_01_FULL_44_29]|uniref:Uncharacterized protein n=1 Tax=Candidatus Daviesbacteria bacterium RIFCSPHIGHO2_02_FULL_43_12 TaxID=1797776 RepID=A0A1F5KK52_9BACT|nr:MAG: hypothetical protein A2631_02225 [Candidatus Daviesbacteria bacterium RIFCSPHIGHO2_01_FULL_44_29]OGE41005.1 MAG: hypothetical protein A3E86_03730 [Candidatus Daviesbacteria bacterium RIFCSPHIGHO2_12_FULL_47_45]OGE41209.1 MAG: hypothetical protein A3D25_01620 [Candidatus Daviesbacteria bacterium RIFCSPHIGHO2_02_FULL_43_12]OGE69409.1 MAG: hypothetical protein A3B55_03360 [Candidatus Daviesbacteria bacterium RIFCSPLOWO2_01_FULL_43_15]
MDIGLTEKPINIKDLSIEMPPSPNEIFDPRSKFSDSDFQVIKDQVKRYDYTTSGYVIDALLVYPDKDFDYLDSVVWTNHVQDRLSQGHYEPFLERVACLKLLSSELLKGIQITPSDRDNLMEFVGDWFGPAVNSKGRWDTSDLVTNVVIVDPDIVRKNPDVNEIRDYLEESYKDEYEFEMVPDRWKGLLTLASAIKIAFPERISKAKLTKEDWKNIEQDFENRLAATRNEPDKLTPYMHILRMAADISILRARDIVATPNEFKLASNAPKVVSNQLPITRNF